jgi:four helix bundle protein
MRWDELPRFGAPDGGTADRGRNATFDRRALWVVVACPTLRLYGSSGRQARKIKRWARWSEIIHWPLTIGHFPFFSGGAAMKPEELSERLLDFAVRTGKVVDALPATKLGRHVASQLVRCCTSPPPNYEEACAAECRSDFIHKLSIVLKELRESRCWLRLIVRAELLAGQRLETLLDEAEQLRKIIGSSLNTAKENGRKSK